MEAATVQRFQYSSAWIDWRNFESKPLGSLCFTQRVKEDKSLRTLALAHLQPDKRRDHRQRSVPDKNSSGSDQKSMNLSIGFSIWKCRFFSFWLCPFDDKEMIFGFCSIVGN